MEHFQRHPALRHWLSSVKLFVRHENKVVPPLIIICDIFPRLALSHRFYLHEKDRFPRPMCEIIALSDDL